MFEMRKEGRNSPQYAASERDRLYLLSQGWKEVAPIIMGKTELIEAPKTDPFKRKPGMALIGEGGYAAAGQLTHADGALAGSLSFVSAVLPRFDVPKPFAAYPRVAAYWEAIAKDPHIAKLLGEIQEGLKKAFPG